MKRRAGAGTRSAHRLGTVLCIAGIVAFAWAGVTWRLGDPVTALYTRWRQHTLATELNRRFSAYAPPARSQRGVVRADWAWIRRAARAYRRDTYRGEAIGWIRIRRIGLRMVLVNGTDDASLRSGPGRYLGSFMPGEGRMTYIAGHRTTYLAPLAHIDAIRRGDRVSLVMPYGTFVYSVTRRRIVAANDTSVLHAGRGDKLELQACHPRFSASHRYVVFASLVGVIPATANRSALAGKPSKGA